MVGANFSKILLVLTVAAVLPACSQARRGVGNRGATEEIWSAQGGLENLCSNLRGARYNGCFSLSVNVTSNVAYLEVGSLPWNSGDFVPYRVLARPHGSSKFYLLLDNINSDVGSEVELPAYGNQAITSYEEWRVETTMVLSTTNGIDLVPAASGRGQPLAQTIIIWPELAKQQIKPNANK